MTYLTLPSTPEVIRLNCHSIAHYIGRETFEKSKTIEDAMQSCSNSCGMGCIHGVIGGAVLKDL